jgi:hypothetical protein
MTNSVKLGKLSNAPASILEIGVLPKVKDANLLANCVLIAGEGIVLIPTYSNITLIYSISNVLKILLGKTTFVVFNSFQLAQ